jgi:hypothetical protein
MGGYLRKPSFEPVPNPRMTLPCRTRGSRFAIFGAPSVSSGKYVEFGRRARKTFLRTCVEELVEGSRTFVG